MNFSIQTHFFDDFPFLNGPREKCVVKAKRREWKFFNEKVDSFNRIFERSEGCFRIRKSFLLTSDGYKKRHAKKVRSQLKNDKSIYKACRRRFKGRRCTRMFGKLVEATRKIGGSAEEPGPKPSNPKSSTPQYATCKYPMERRAHERLRSEEPEYREHVVAKPTKNRWLVCLGVRDRYHYPLWPFGKGMRATELGKLRDKLAMRVSKDGEKSSVESWYWLGWRVYSSEHSSSAGSWKTRCAYIAKTWRSKKACDQLIDDLEKKRRTLTERTWLEMVGIFVGLPLLGWIVRRTARFIKGLIERGGPRGPSGRGGGGGIKISDPRRSPQDVENTDVVSAPHYDKRSVFGGASEYSAVARRLADAQGYFSRRDVQADISGIFGANVPPRNVMKAPANRIFFVPMIRTAVPRIRANFKLRATPRPRLQLRVR